MCNIEDLVKEQKHANDICEQFREDAKKFVAARIVFALRVVTIS